MSNHLFSAVPEQSFGPAVPGNHNAMKIGGPDSIRGGFYDDCSPLQGNLIRLPEQILLTFPDLSCAPTMNAYPEHDYAQDAEGIKPDSPVKMGLEIKAECGAGLVPNAIFIGGNYSKPIFTRRKIGVIDISF